jgi:hypothetical protein
MPAYLKKQFVSLLFFSSALVASSKDNVEVNLKNPLFEEGVLYTEEGGVILGSDIRIQAQKIYYTNKVEEGKNIQKLMAEGDLLFEYKGKFFVGSRLDYDLINQSGTLLNGRTSDGLWFIGGERIDLEGNGNYTIYGAFVTTSESIQPTWSIRSEKVDLKDNAQVSTSKVRFTYAEVPLLWLPSFKANLKDLSNPPIRYKVVWDKGLGPRLSMRYRIFSWEDLSLFFRLDYRLTKGPGAAFESEYASKDEKATFVTRSYGAYDKEVYDEHGLKRYRLQGLFTYESQDERTQTRLTYDKYRDLKMISDFPSSDFEIDTQKRTQLLVYHQEDTAFASIRLEPRLNNFESINQKLPLGKIGIRPFAIGSSGILSENYVSAGYLDYVYAKELLSTYPVLHERHAVRVETKNRLYRPISTGPLHVTPTMGVVGIFYNNSQFHSSSGQAALTYGGNVHSLFYRNYPHLKHSIKPYLDYFGLSKPRASLSQHYIFSIDDGLYQINSLKMGLANIFYLKNSHFFSPTIAADLHTYAFFNDTTFTKRCPKAYFSLTISEPSYLIQGDSCWNFQENILDFCNVKTDFTVNAHVACSFEVRHRSRYDWRKADHENFILDMARSIPELENSPLSDRRNTFLSTLHLKLSHKWSAHFSSHYGWGRVDEPSYNSFKLDLFTLLASHWKMRFSYLHTTNDDRVTTQIQLIK